MLFSPSLTGWLLSAEPRGVTELETFTIRTTGITFLLISFLLLLLTGEIHNFYSSSSPADGNTSNTAPEMAQSVDMEKSPFAAPAVYATMLFHAVYAAVMYGYSWSRFLSGGWLTTGAVMHFMLAGGGLLLVMFGQGPGRVSKRTGADKRTSGFPFKNSEASKRKAR